MRDVRRSGGRSGAGYVGLTTAACLSHLGHSVRCVDSDATRVERLRRGWSTFSSRVSPSLCTPDYAAGRCVSTPNSVHSPRAVSWFSACPRPPAGTAHPTWRA
ncbi:hypothetical protein GS436_00005 [Rhodococcus hoagii]|nr:hypothetical protein [Prescottella equi]